ncbi:MAG TPA: OB-fold nucleic acid binding domain-containing protein [Nitrospiraceae bacterium]|nr:OB-fold nucleic acid binding domain-containing protein [Nitrospiraceae bacterium]
MKCPLLRRALPFGLVCLFLWAGSVLATERLTVGQLKKYHASYQMHAVTLVGRVQNMQDLPSIETSNKSKQCSSLYGIAQFELVDDTGTLQADIVGSCASAAMKLPGNGDVIELTAKIQVFPSEGRTEQVIRAIAQNIVVLKPALQDPQSP